jgi:antitoxin component YwqK of YwqJK toxin-antitoxin module
MPSSKKLYYPSGALYADLSVAKRAYFYEDGGPKTFEPYLEDKLHGEAVLYWQNGQVKRKSSFQKGIRHGFDRMWTDGGQLVDEGNYEMGKPTGTHRRWSPLGNLIEEIRYIDPVRFEIRLWDESGELRIEGLWKGDAYLEKTWDISQKIWTEKKGRWDGKKVVYV